jgi:Ca-activated chloride channel family protein
VLGELTLLGLLGVNLLSVPQEGEEVRFTLGVDVDLVVFNVTVTDGDGALVRGLTQDDFQVVEDDLVQEIGIFRAESAPATVGLIVDSSGSMREIHDDVAEASHAFAEASGPEDEFFLVMFNENAFVYRVDSTPAQLRAAVLRRPPEGLTAFYDALAVGLENLQGGSRDRKALLVLSDGGDNASQRALEDVLQLIRRSSATIYTVDIYDPYNRDRDPGVLREIAELTGGRAYFIESVDDLEQIWRDVARGIQAQYTLGYYAANTAHDGAFRSVRIQAVRDGQEFNVRTRRGYLAPAEGN